MIVQCDKCRTKFRIADNKVSDGGVKVRCSRCAHVFVVRTDAVGVSPIPKFSDRGPDTARVDPMTLANLAAASSPPGLEMPQNPWTAPFPAGAKPDATVPGFLAPAPKAASFPPAANTTSEQLAAALGFAGVPAPKAGPPAATQTSQVTERGPPPLPGFSGPGDFSEARTVQTKVPASLPPKVATDAALPSFPDAGRGASPLPKGPPTAQMRIPKAATDPNPSVRFPAPAALTRGDDFPSGGIPGAMTEMNLEPPSNTDFGPAPDFGGGNDFPAPPPSSDMNHALAPAGALSDDPFANVDVDVAPAYSLQNAGAEIAQPQGLSPANEILARIDLGKAGVGFNDNDPFGTREETAHAVDAFADAPRSRITAAAALPQLEHRVRRWPTTIGVVVGLAIAAFVYPGVAPELVQAFQARALDPLLRPSERASLLPEGLATVRAVDATVTTYPAADKKPLLVVKGIAENTSSQPLSDLEAVVLVMDGPDIKERQSAPLGVVLDPGSLSRIGSPGDLTAALAKAGGATDAKKPLAPGEGRPFMVVFPAVPADVATRTFHVEFAVRTSARRDEP